MGEDEKNSKSEIRNPKQIQMIQAPNPRPLVASSVVREEGGSLEHLNFGFVSDFVLRISDFGRRKMHGKGQTRQS
jgi:hypothetical protein